MDKNFLILYILTIAVIWLYVKLLQIQEDFDTLFHMVLNLEERSHIESKKEQDNG